MKYKGNGSQVLDTHMPLIKGKSEKAFKQNVRTEMHAGKPQKQSLAIAYSMKRKAERKKMADGGTPNPNSPSSMGVPSGVLSSMNISKHAKGGEVHSCPQCGYADGGYVGGDQITDNYQSKTRPEVDRMFAHEPAENASGWATHEGDTKRPNHSAMAEDDRSLNQHGEEEEGPQGVWMAEGGQIIDNKQSDAHMLDMVGRIMAQRQRMYSEGGKVANDTHQFDSSFDKNQFDDLVLDDDLSSTYGDDNNAGDENDNAGENARRSDIVSRIMSSRNKKSSFTPGYKKIAGIKGDK